MAVNAEFNWWLLIVGLVVGAGLVWFVLADGRRREIDVEPIERELEVAWLVANLAQEGRSMLAEDVHRILALHRAYLEAPPPDEVNEHPFGAPGGPSLVGPDDAERP